MTAVRLASFEIHATDPDASVRFYSTALGWEFTEHPFADTSYWSIATEEGQADGRLIRRMGPPAAKGAPVMGAVITAYVDDVDACSARVLEAGGAVALPKMELPGAGWFAYFLDPDDNVFGVFQSAPEA